MTKSFHSKKSAAQKSDQIIATPARKTSAARSLSSVIFAVRGHAKFVCTKPAVSTVISRTCRHDRSFLTLNQSPAASAAWYATASSSCGAHFWNSTKNPSNMTHRSWPYTGRLRKKICSIRPKRQLSRQSNKNKKRKKRKIWSKSRR
jgi:hypothetical protein